MIHLRLFSDAQVVAPIRGWRSPCRQQSLYIEFAVNNVKDPAMLEGGNLIAVLFFLEQSKVSKQVSNQVRRCPQFGMLSDCFYLCIFTVWTFPSPTSQA
jgi:hypothetical protein